MNKWDKRLLDLAFHIADWSKDPSTKVGAVIARPNNTICSTGYNGFPRGFDDSDSIYADRDAKIARVVHAEMNAILTAPEPVNGYTLYCTLMPCGPCMLHVIQSGIKKVYCPMYSRDEDLRWQFDTAVQYAAEAGIDVLVVP